MDPTAILSLVEAGLRVIATAAPAIYRAIVPDGRSVEQVIADARKAAEALPARPAGDAIDAWAEQRRREQRAEDDTREVPVGPKR